MIKAKHHIIVNTLFNWLTSFLLKRNFNSLQINSDFADNGNPILIIANHISWWDGFWILYLNKKVIHRKFHFMMLEEYLKKHWYFQYIGGYSIKKKSREILKSIEYTIELLKKNDNLVLMFPQGKIHSAYNSSIHFEKGIQNIVSKSKNEIQILFVANFTEYFSNSKPNLFMYTKTYSSTFLKNKNIEEEYNLFYNQILNKHNTKIS